MTRKITQLTFTIGSINAINALRLEQCINRKLKKFQGLTLHFLSEGMFDATFCRLEKAFSNPMAELYLQFFQSSLVTFTSFNKFLQGEDPLIYLQHFQINNFMNKLMKRFIKSEVIQALTESSQSFCESDVSLNIQKPDQ